MYRASAVIKRGINFTLIENSGLYEVISCSSENLFTNNASGIRLSNIFNSDYATLITGELSPNEKVSIDLQSITKSFFDLSETISFTGINYVIVENKSNQIGYDLNIHSTGTDGITSIFNGGSGNFIVKPLTSYIYSSVIDSIEIDETNKTLTLEDVGGNGIEYSVGLLGLTGVETIEESDGAAVWTGIVSDAWNRVGPASGWGSTDGSGHLESPFSGADIPDNEGSNFEWKHYAGTVEDNSAFTITGGEGRHRVQFSPNQTWALLTGIENFDHPNFYAYAKTEIEAGGPRYGLILQRKSDSGLLVGGVDYGNEEITINLFDSALGFDSNKSNGSTPGVSDYTTIIMYFQFEQSTETFHFRFVDPDTEDNEELIWDSNVSGDSIIGIGLYGFGPSTLYTRWDHFFGYSGEPSGWPL